MKLDELTIGEVKQLLQLVGGGGSGSQCLETKSPFEVGKAYLIRTVTHYQTGRVKKISGGFLVLEDAAWIPDTGRFNEAVEKGNLSEIEPVSGPMFVGVGAIIDAVEWKRDLPRAVK